MPMMPLSGVRISWLMFIMNSDLIRRASSRVSRAAMSWVFLISSSEEAGAGIGEWPITRASAAAERVSSRSRTSRTRRLRSATCLRCSKLRNCALATEKSLDLTTKSSTPALRAARTVFAGGIVGEDYQRDRLPVRIPHLSQEGRVGRRAIEEYAIGAADYQQFQRFFDRARDRHLVVFDEQLRRERAQVGGFAGDTQQLLVAEQAFARVGGPHDFARVSERAESNQQQRAVFAFAHEGVGTRLERADLSAGVVRIGEEDARNLAQQGIGLDSPDEGQTVNSRHLAVDHDCGRLDFRGQPQSLRVTLALREAISVWLDQLLEPIAKGLAGIDHEQAGGLPCPSVQAAGAHQLLGAAQQIALFIGLADIFVGAGG